MRILVIGSSMIDLFLSIEDESHITIDDSIVSLRLGDKIPTNIQTLTLGGNGANVSVGLSRLGHEAVFFTYLANDLFSKQIREAITHEKVQLMVEERKEGKTSISLIFNFKKDRIIFSHHELANHGFFYKDTLYPQYAYLASIGARWEKAYTYAVDFLVRNAIPYAFSPGSHQLRDMGEACIRALKNAASLFINKEEAVKLLQEIGENPPDDINEMMKQLQAQGPKLISITDGAAGSYALDENGKTYFKKPHASISLEKTGAGDAYASGFLASYLYNNPIDTCMSWGAINASSVMQKVGAQEGLLTKEELESCIKMKANLGYDRNLYILPFDHRTSFAEGIFGIKDRDITSEDHKKIIEAKQIVYEAFEFAVATEIPKEEAAILVDEEYGDAILRDAKQKGYVTLLTTEKSGQKEFSFEYAEKFSDHLQTFQPTFAKALIRYNPHDNSDLKKRQQTTLRVLSDYCANHNLKFLIEPLIIPTADELLTSFNNDKTRFDRELRPKLTVQMIEELQHAGIEADVWKIEGMEQRSDYEAVVRQARADRRDKVGVVILGRGASSEQVEQWIRAGKNIPGIIGFAIGRTIFNDPLIAWKDQKITREQAIEQIADKYIYFYHIFTQ